jgi:hypothetical protein
MSVTVAPKYGSINGSDLPTLFGINVWKTLGIELALNNTAAVYLLSSCLCILLFETFCVQCSRRMAYVCVFLI